MSQNEWSTLHWQRRLETFGKNDSAILSSDLKNDPSKICESGEITDKGRETTLALGSRLRTLYVSQLAYLPSEISQTTLLHLRASPMPRALASVQQVFAGLYPIDKRTASFTPPPINSRIESEETIYPNTAACKRFRELVAAFADRTAQRWNNTPEMAYLNTKLSKYMPQSSPRVKVDSHPRLSGIMDTINSTSAHGPATRLPSAFYDPKLLSIVNRIGVEEWFSGYADNAEYRTLGIGALAGDLVEQLILRADPHSKQDPLSSTPSSAKITLSGCHDTTLASLLTSLDAFPEGIWPPYTSHLAIELFKDPSATPSPNQRNNPLAQRATQEKQRGALLSYLLPTRSPQPIARRPLTELSEAEKARLKGWYVRLRYNDSIVQIPACRPKGKHWAGPPQPPQRSPTAIGLDTTNLRAGGLGSSDAFGGAKPIDEIKTTVVGAADEGGDTSFCTLEAFKSVVDGFTPRNWRDECVRNVGKPAGAGIQAPVEGAGRPAQG